MYHLNHYGNCGSLRRQLTDDELRKAELLDHAFENVLQESVIITLHMPGHIDEKYDFAAQKGKRQMTFMLLRPKGRKVTFCHWAGWAREKAASMALQHIRFGSTVEKLMPASISNSGVTCRQNKRCFENLIRCTLEASHAWSAHRWWPLTLIVLVRFIY